MTPQIKLIPSYDGELIYTETYQNNRICKNNLIIAHGLGGDSNATLLFIKTILKKIPSTKCITYDLRGHGYSSKRISTKEKNIENIGGKDLASICNHFKINNPILVGHSFGGVFIQNYLTNNLKPTPKLTFLICSPIKILPLSISRKFWFSLYKKVSPFLKINTKKRTLNQHLKYKYTFDISAPRVFLDALYTGFLNFILIYLSLLGWENKNLESLNKESVYFCCGTKDVLLPEKKQRNFLRKLHKIKINNFDSNHHQIYSKNYEVLTMLIKDTINS